MELLDFQNVNIVMNFIGTNLFKFIFNQIYVDNV